MKDYPSPEKVSPSRAELKNLSAGCINLPQNASEAKNFWARSTQRPRTSIGLRSARYQGQMQASSVQYGSPKSPNMGYDFTQSLRGTQLQQQTLASLMNVSAGQLPIGGALASALINDDEDGSYSEKNLFRADGERGVSLGMCIVF